MSYNKVGCTVNGKVMDYLEVGKMQSLLLLTSDFISMYKKSTNYGLICKQYSVVWNISIENFT